MRRIVVTMVLTAMLFLFIITSLIGNRAFGQNSSDSRPPTVVSGAPVEELQISVLLETVNESESSPQFRVELRSVGDHDLILNLGMMLANGRSQYADAITLLLTLLSGSEQRLRLMGPAMINGRADPFVVPLPMGASFSIPVDLTKYAPFGRGRPLKLEPGSYALQAEFQGRPGVNPNLDMKGMALMPYWTGTVVSTKIEFKIKA
jgi:hypothetical protein